MGTLWIILPVIALVVVCSVLVVLDAIRHINLLHPLPLTPYLLVAPNYVVWAYYLYNIALGGLSHTWRIALLAPPAILVFYLWVRLHVFPFRDGQKTGPRLKIMIGGRPLVYSALWGMVLNAVFLPLTARWFLGAGVPQPVVLSNVFYAVACLFALLVNGILRIFFTSRRLSILRRLLMVLTMWIPLVNLAVLLLACHKVYEEYDFACYKRDLHLVRADSDICRTKYPLVMVHGVLFRDLKYFNYWGRIPKELMRYGATIYYGNQAAAGTIASNGADIVAAIDQALAETGAEKVNIIAHSKGGLDARYAITALGAGDKVASLTTLCSPHRGCRFVDQAIGFLPDKAVHFIARIINGIFGRLGDENPDFFTVAHQFTTANSEAFNKQVPDHPGVYYQSYTAQMKNALSDPMLGPTYTWIRKVSGPNDGLVNLEAGQWGRFRGVLSSTGRRGVSHGDIIDLKREDYKGFDILETFVGIVGDLKEQGY